MWYVSAPRTALKYLLWTLNDRLTLRIRDQLNLIRVVRFILVVTNSQNDFLCLMASLVQSKRENLEDFEKHRGLVSEKNEKEMNIMLERKLSEEGVIS